MKIAGLPRALMKFGVAAFAVSAAVLTAPAASAAPAAEDNCLKDPNNVYFVCPVILGAEPGAALTVSKTYTLQAPHIGKVTFFDVVDGKRTQVGEVAAPSPSGSTEIKVAAVQWTPATAGNRQLVVRTVAGNVSREYQPRSVTVNTTPAPGAGSSLPGFR